MRVNRMTVVSAMPDLGMLTNGNCSKHVLERINSRFGSNDVRGRSLERFSRFKADFIDTTENTLKVIQSTKHMVQDNAKYSGITCTDDLKDVPAAMYVPIMTYPPLREMLDKDLLYGWGIDKDVLPDGDPYGRAINNGMYEIDPVTNKFPDRYVWEWELGDPELEYEELDIIQDARRFIDNFIAVQLANDTKRDPTDWNNHGTIEDIR